MLDQGDIGGEAAAARQFLDARQQEGRDRLAAHAALARFAQRLLDEGVDLIGLHRRFLRHRVADHHAAGHAELPLGADEGRLFFRRIDLEVGLEAAVAGEEGGEGRLADAHHRYAMGLQVFEGEADVEDGLHARAHHRHAGMGQLLQVGRDVEAGLGAAMHAADAPGDEDFDAGQGGADHGRGHGGGAQLALGQHVGQVAAAHLDRIRRGTQQLQLVVGQADADLAADDGDGGRHGARVADHLLDFARGVHVLRIGHAVRDDGRLQGDDGLAGGACAGDFGRKEEEGLHGQSRMSS